MKHLHIITNEFKDGSCLNYSPRNFNWIFNQYPSSGPVVYFNGAINIGLNDAYKGPKYGWLGESSELSVNLMNELTPIIAVLKQKFIKIFVNDYRLIELDKKLFCYNPPASNLPWIINPALYDKTKLCSYITSFKGYTTGHKIRLSVYNQIKNHPMFKDNIFGKPHNPIENKITGLRDYMFSIVIENAKYPKYYTEKVTDCFATGTIPLYYGDKSICEDFDEDGIIFIDEKLDLNLLSKELYESKIKSVEANFVKLLQLNTADDCIFESINNDKAKYQ